MKFVRIVFISAGIWGIVVLIPLYWRVDLTGYRYTLPNDPQFFYGFLSVTMAWQIAFLVIGSNPTRLRPLMVPAIIEKIGYVLTVVMMHSGARILSRDILVVMPDLLLGILFILALGETPQAEPSYRPVALTEMPKTPPPRVPA
jgi:hypothetical protein